MQTREEVLLEMEMFRPYFDPDHVGAVVTVPHQQYLRWIATLRSSQPAAPVTLPTKEGESFAATCDRVCRDLPEGWGIVIELEKDSGVIVLEDPNAEGVDFPTNNEKFEQTLNDAVEFAIEQAAPVAMLPKPEGGEQVDPLTQKIRSAFGGTVPYDGVGK